MRNMSESVEKQVGPCGITCGTCPLGNGTIAESAKKTKEYINTFGIKEWAPMVPGGSELDWNAADKVMDWVGKYGQCLGCEQGGGPPDCAIRQCANAKGVELCNECDEVRGCEKFEWLGDYGKDIRVKLADSPGILKEEWRARAK